MATRKSTNTDQSKSSGMTMTSAEKIAAARKLQEEKNASDYNLENEIENEPLHERKREINLLKHTETIDRLVIQNKQLQRDLNDADNDIDDLEKKLSESYVKISKNLLYTVLGVILYISYLATSQFNGVNEKLVEMNILLRDYKSEIEKSKMYNEILEKKLNITKGEQ